MDKMCQLCGSAEPGPGLNRFCGLGICEVCHRSELYEARQFLGAQYQSQLSSRVVTQKTSSGGTRRRTIYTLTIECRFPPVGKAYNATFKTEKVGAIQRFFRETFNTGDPTVGDELFDDNVWIDARDSGEMVWLLKKIPGLQDVIMEVLMDGGTLEMRDGVAIARLEAEEVEPTEGRIPDALLAIPAHLRALATRGPSY